MATELRQAQNPLPLLLCIPPSIHTPALLFHIQPALLCTDTSRQQASDVSQHRPLSAATGLLQLHFKPESTILSGPIH